MKILNYSILLIMAVYISTSYSQPPGPGGGPMGDLGPRRQKMRERIKIVKISELTEAIDLTPEQSERFFPIYNEHQKKHERLEFERREIIDKIRKLSDKDDVSENDLDSAVDELIAFDSKFADLRRNFMKDISGVLSIKQRARLLVFEEDFRRKVQENIRDIRRNMRGQGGTRPR